MATLTEAVQAQLRTVTGTAGTYNEDWHAYATYKSIALGSWDGRVLALAKVIDTTIPTISAAHNYFLQHPTAITA